MAFAVADVDVAVTAEGAPLCVGLLMEPMLDGEEEAAAAANRVGTRGYARWKRKQKTINFGKRYVIVYS